MTDAPTAATANVANAEAPTAAAHDADGAHRAGRRPTHPVGGFRDPFVAAALLVALGLRMATAGSQSLWYDEVFTVRVVDGSLAGVWRGVADLETTPPLYYLLAWGWTQLVSTGEAQLRLLSALFAVGAVWLSMRTALLVAGRAAMAWTGAFLAVSPMLVWFGQEARAYALLLLCTAGMTHTAVRWTREPGRARHVAAWAGWAAAGVATHYIGWLVAGCFAVVMLAGGVRARARVAVASLLPMATALVLVPLLLHQKDGGRTDWITETPLSTRLLLVPKQLMVGLEAPRETPVAALVLMVCAGLALWGVWRCRSHALALIIASGSLVLAGAIGAAIAGIDLVLARNLVVVLPVVLLAAGIGASVLPRRALLAVPASLMLVMATVSIVITTQGQWRRPDWRAAVATAPSDGSPLLVAPSMQKTVVDHYATDRAASSTVNRVTAVTALVGPPISGGGEFIAPPHIVVQGVPGRLDRIREFGLVQMATYRLERTVQVPRDGTSWTVTGLPTYAVADR